MVISGSMVQSNTHRAEANVDRDVSLSKRDLLLFVPSASELLFCKSEEDSAGGGGPYRMPDVVVVRLLLLPLRSNDGDGSLVVNVSPNENVPPSIIVLGLISSSLLPTIFRSPVSVMLLSRVVDVVLRRYMYALCM